MVGSVEGLPVGHWMWLLIGAVTAWRYNAAQDEGEAKQDLFTDDSVVREYMYKDTGLTVIKSYLFIVKQKNKEENNTFLVKLSPRDKNV